MLTDTLPSVFINEIPSGYLCISFILFYVIFSQAGLYIFHLIYRPEKQQRGNEVAGIIFGGMSAIYSLILAFVIVAVWSNYDDLNKIIENEGDKLNGILSHSQKLPHDLKIPIQNSLYSYCNQVVYDEWHMKNTNEADQPSAIPKLRLLLLDTKPEGNRQQGIFTVIDEDLSTISDLRRDRLDHNRSQVPALVWFILKAGSIMLIIFSYFFQVPSMLLKRIYLLFLSSFIAMCLLLVYQLDHPFAGSAMVSNLAYRNVMAELKSLQ
ncbi:DUF4239 domain-containing protein [Mucilaginibacter sp. SMC90]|uniref:bestrophin-like domain n=1 Tax=Mucilaginibacter sp. SMC90 TaxID=2929803 RepID=UPI001FB31408|nr:DUF4239 domain-containing protein [Mucilaginibacter sp. SMC90]UOE46238.1 DUF4239 domain-containing protein [Mucilaginibacter sp. SMC90]